VVLELGKRFEQLLRAHFNEEFERHVSSLANFTANVRVDVGVVVGAA
jgi:hypothetical protein